MRISDWSSDVCSSNLADSGKIALAALPVLQKNGARAVRLLGTELWNTETGLSRVPAMHGAWFASVPDDYFRQFASRYRPRFGGEPYRMASRGYDSVMPANRGVETRSEEDREGKNGSSPGRR